MRAMGGYAFCVTVHTYGDVSDSGGLATGGHFVGTCNGCRPAGALQEVGLLNNGKPLSVTGNIGRASFVDLAATLRGVNSIIGRSVVIHNNGTNSTAGAGIRVAQCVIGWDAQPTVAACT